MSQAGFLVYPRLPCVLTNWESGGFWLPVLALFLPSSRPVGVMIYK